MSPRRRVVNNWPWPGATPTDKARELARLYREAGLSDDPLNAVARVDAIAQRREQGWVVPQRAQWQLDDLLTADELVDYFCVKPRTIDAWVSRGLKATDTVDGRRYRYGDIVDYQAQQRLRRRAAARERIQEGNHCGTVASS